jgi:hypothetical protein
LSDYNRRRTLKKKEKSIECVSLQEIEHMNLEMSEITEMPIGSEE